VGEVNDLGIRMTWTAHCRAVFPIIRIGEIMAMGRGLWGRVGIDQKVQAKQEMIYPAGREKT
jgi:hypothetical protein